MARTRDSYPYVLSFPPTSTILPLGGIPGSNSKIPTLGLSPNRAAPAPPGFITVTVLSTSSNNGRCVWLHPVGIAVHCRHRG